MLPEISDLARCHAVFLPGSPARTGRFAFWRPGPDPEAPDATPPAAFPAALPSTLPPGTDEVLATVAPGPAGDPAPRLVSTTARLVSVQDALPLLTRARAVARDEPALGGTAVAFWGAAALQALHLTARGLLLPGLTEDGHDAWRAGPLGTEDHRRVRELAAAMPPSAHCVPLPGPGPLRLPDPEALVRDFLDAVADTLPRSPAAETAAGGPVFAAVPPLRTARPELRAWAADVAAGHDAGVRISLRVELPGLPDSAEAGELGGPGGAGGADLSGAMFRVVLQLHSLGDASVVADAADVWRGTGAAARSFSPRARLDALLALRRAALLWSPLSPMLTAAVPDPVELADEEVTELLGEASRALAADGVDVHWPRQLARRLTARAVVGPPEEPGAPEPSARAGADGPGHASGGASLLSPDALLAFDWSFALGDRPLSRAELDRLAEAGRPLVRLRDQWVLIDPAEARRARRRQDRKVPVVDALAAVLTGTAEVDGERFDVTATGPLERLRQRLADPERRDEPHGPGDPVPPVPQPPGLNAVLRDYQLRGLDWLARMTALGLGGCLADDMGLGKTVTLIALHLHRQGDPATAGPTLVVCPASLLGNWEREVGRFAPGTPVRRFHGGARSLAGAGAGAGAGPGAGAGAGAGAEARAGAGAATGPAAGEIVLTTYGTMRLDAPALAVVPWGLVVADEAQHVKNPRSGTARALRTIGGKARVALTGTPVENNLSELWAVLDWTTPGLLGRLGTFRSRYAAAVEGGTDPLAAQRLAALVRPFLLRRRKSDPGVAPELPPKTETDHPVSLTAEQAGLYEAVVRESLAEIAAADGLARRGLVVKLLTSLKQICNHPAQYLKEERPRVPGRSGKLELLDELLDTVLAEGGSVLVFTQYVAMARIIERHLAARGVAAQLLHGGTPVRRREELVDRFQSGGVPVFLLSLRAAGTGLNLTRAGHVVHYDRWWNPAVEAQATDRAYRIGQTQPVQVHRLVAEGTVEDRIAALLERKKALADAVLAGGETALTELTDAELAELVELRGGME
ncbi:SNF2-related protein [Streptomyces sp. NPDC086023]|uniref:SNF2-related protein n=1 Tax=Streptomyces sp. NPDC086023 TaxID=3365746 RepID=UPI0037CF7F4B